jgi:hypothetical protein
MSLNASIRQWLLLTCIWLLIGGIIGGGRYSNRKSIDAHEREQLTNQTKIIEENLRHELQATDNALNSIRKEMPLSLPLKVETSRSVQT